MVPPETRRLRQSLPLRIPASRMNLRKGTKSLIIYPKTGSKGWKPKGWFFGAIRLRRCSDASSMDDEPHHSSFLPKPEGPRKALGAPRPFNAVNTPELTSVVLPHAIISGCLFAKEKIRLSGR
ncbi:hypothetical protein NPIL_411701 [Nephila pilipes]|uniref:Uncharacterized protein n=1 Tax=Nephila pilipes TaxID=299642 RepID=A0A8X6IKC5_NEPPI|nr:hypothetical protein NPIL_411701 [Nephila pilipes]